MGQNLIAVKASLSRGQFDGWIAKEFQWVRSTAYRLIQVATHFEGSSQIGTIAPSALYLLAEESTPESIREEFVGLAAIGKEVKYRDVKDSVARAKAEAIPIDEWNGGEPEEVPYEVISTTDIIPPPSRTPSTSFAGLEIIQNFWNIPDRRLSPARHKGSETE